MTKQTIPTRRSFLRGGVLLAAPLAAAAVPTAVLADDGLKARLARLEDEAAIRELHQGWLRRINAGTNDTTHLLAHPEGAAFGQAVRTIVADHGGEPDAIEVATDGASAAGRFPCAVEIESMIAPDCTLAQMAHAQGGGFVRRTERRVLRVKYVKTSGAWMVSKVEFTQI